MAEDSGKTGVPILSVEGLHAGYGAHEVLRGVDLAVRPGELMGLIGPNGAGKTTLFRAVTGSLPPESGAVRLGGKPLDALTPGEAARRMAFTPQVLDVVFSFTVESFVEMGRHPHRGRFAPLGARDRDVVRRSMALVDLLEFAGRPLNTLSGGERQRAVVAQALAQEPEVLLLDEPAAYLDVNHQVEIFELLHRVRDRGPAVVVILHDLNLASEYCERIALLHEGRIAADGPPGDVITQAMLADAFGVRLEISPDPITGRPLVRYRRAARPGAAGRGIRVHVLCGGGTGVFLLRRLHIEGAEVTTGVLNEGDSDLAYARSLGIPAVEEAPFSAVGEAAAGKTRAFMEKADVILISAVPFGEGNLRNLQAVPKDRARATVFVEPGAEWDFSGGKARALVEGLRAGGARFVASDREALEAVRALATEGDSD
ncbi:MAG: ABC transporter ATP-binding protein [Planctomycetota bacterium]|jgi:iron complex transport system ATP-binding protein